MTFTEIIKNDAEQKYLNLLAGTLELPVPKIDIHSCKEYKEKAHSIHQRLTQEAEAIKEALNSIKENKKLRIKEEKSAAKNAPVKTSSSTETNSQPSPLKKWLFIGIGGLIAWAIMPKAIKTILIIAAVVAVGIWIVKKKKK